MNNQLNPYIAGAPITEAKMFFGRQDVFEWIEQNMIGRYVDHILVIHGQRRVGKTSILKQLSNRLSEQYIPIFLDLQGRSQITFDRFLWWMARETVRTLKQDRGIMVDLPNPDVFTRDPDFFENQFLPGLHPLLENHVLLFAIDEFDVLENVDNKEFQNKLYDFLKRLLNKEGVTFIFSVGSSGRKLENMQAAYTGLFKTALYKRISFLSKEDSHKLVKKPVEGLLIFTQDALERIYSLSSGHPYFIQLICHELFGIFQKTGKNRFDYKDINAIIDDVIERGSVNLKFVWDEASPTEKWVLTGLAHVSEKPNVRNLSTFLKSKQVIVKHGSLQSALLHLREREVITENNQFQIHLMRVWLLKNRPIERVREEISVINSSINQVLKNGIDYGRTGLIEEAIVKFQEVLRIDPLNLEARIQLASCFLNQSDFDKAIDEYKAVLILDSENPAARKGLCSAYLALGDESKKGDEEKVHYYREVLKIDPKNRIARHKLKGLGISVRSHFSLSIQFSIIITFSLLIFSIYLLSNPLAFNSNFNRETGPATSSSMVFTQVPTRDPKITLIPTYSKTPTPIRTQTPTLTIIPTVDISPTITSMPEILTDQRGVRMALVPSGKFLMGGNANDALIDCQNSCPTCNCEIDMFSDAEPIHEVYIDNFYMDLTEVTNAQYIDCVEADICTPPHYSFSITRRTYYGQSNFDNYPVIYIDWFQASTFCNEWRGGRLPTEAEWEKATRSEESYTYSWGNEIDCTRANYAGCIGDTSEVGSYINGISPYGILDLNGNVLEWTADWYSANFYYGSPQKNPVGPAQGTQKIVRGGSWYVQKYRLRSDYRYSFVPTHNHFSIGFRCVSTP